MSTDAKIAAKPRPTTGVRGPAGVWKKGALLARILNGEPSEEEEEASVQIHEKQTRVVDRRIAHLHDPPTQSELRQIIPINLGFTSWVAKDYSENFYDDSDYVDWRDAHEVGSDCWTSYGSLEPWSDDERDQNDNDDDDYPSDYIDDEPMFLFHE